MSSLSQFAPRIKSLQRGVATVTNGSYGDAAITVTISSVNMNKTELRNLGSRCANNGASDLGMRLTDATTISFVRDLAYTRYQSYEVVEYY